MVINLPQDILFAPGSASLGRDGRETLSQIASVLSEFSDRTFQVEGHTDDLPIHTKSFPSNWELSAARALNIVKYLASEGNIEPSRLSAIGYGEYRPLVPNTSEANRMLNRRIEIFVDYLKKKTLADSPTASK